MTGLNKAELRRLAEDTKGWQNLIECWPADQELSDADWEVGALDEDDNQYPVIGVNTRQYDCEDGAEKLARFIAAANPAAVLSLLDECEKLQADTSSMRGSLSSYARNMKAQVKLNTRLHRERDAALAERDQHREMSGCLDLLRRDLIEAGVIGDACPPLFMTEAILGYFGQLRAELEACRKDARRWWCVRNAVQLQSPYAVWREGSHPVLGKDADDLVDNFLAQVKEADHA